MADVLVPGFLPSVSGLRFPNAFPDQPAVEIPVGGRTVKIGNAADGLCGGMVFAVRDLYEAGLPPPQTEVPPARDSAPFRYLLRRLIESWDLPVGGAKYVLWMTLPDRDSWFGRGVLTRTARDEWPVVKRELDGGRPSALGLVRVRSWNPSDLGRNHQVLAYGYDPDEDDGGVALRVYDPNHPRRDDLTLRLRTRQPLVPPSYLPGEVPVRGFFRTRYRRADPAPLFE